MKDIKVPRGITSKVNGIFSCVIHFSFNSQEINFYKWVCKIKHRITLITNNTKYRYIPKLTTKNKRFRRK